MSINKIDSSLPTTNKIENKQHRYIGKYKHKFNCGCGACKMIRGETTGKNNFFYKNGISCIQHYCFICQKEITFQAKLCPSCANRIRNSGRKRQDISLLFKNKKRPEHSERMKFKGNPRFIDGRTSLYSLIKNLQEYKQWRKAIYERDNYICQDCYIKGNGRNLEAHHKKWFAVILNEFLRQYSQFSPIEDKETLVRLAISYKDFWDVNNGKTLCRKCHIKTKNYGSKEN